VVYALLRRRARLARLAELSAGAPRDAPDAGEPEGGAAAALVSFDQDWGGWLTSAMTGTGAPRRAPARDGRAAAAGLGLLVVPRPRGVTRGVAGSSSSGEASASEGTLEGLWAAATAVAQRRPPQARGAAAAAATEAAALSEEDVTDGSAAGGFAMDDRNIAEAEAMEAQATPPQGHPSQRRGGE